jgi:hypothetical protein
MQQTAPSELVVKNAPPSFAPKNPVQHLQESTIGLYPKPTEYNPRLHTLFHEDLFQQYIVVLSLPKSSKTLPLTFSGSYKCTSHLPILHVAPISFSQK